MMKAIKNFMDKPITWGQALSGPDLFWDCMQQSSEHVLLTRSGRTTRLKRKC